MRKVFTDNLPKGGGRVNKNNINWNDSKGKRIKFIYDSLEGELEILNYNKENRKLLIRYDDREKEIRTSQLLRGEIGNVLGIIISDYRYNVNDIVETLTGNIKILEQTKNKRKDYYIKSYKYQCVNDHYTSYITEDLLKNGVGCPVCSNKKIVKGINDINTTHPHLVKYFVNIEDTFKYSYGSKKKVKLKCPNCGHKKELSPDILNKQGLSCNKCSDGISYPEKFVFNMLSQLSIEFEVQKNFNWAKGKKYDFYIPSINCIIETHGLQHYEDKIIIYGKSASEEQINDELKKNLALSNGITNYIELDCRYSELKYMHTSIVNSELNNIFDLSNVDWLKCHEFACNSRVKEASNYWMNGVKNTKEISKLMKITQPNITKYLKKEKH